MVSDVDVVIVGAGAAGLGAAKRAGELGMSFALLEASHRIGGRAYTEEFAPGVPFDLGCHWMHSASLNPFVAIADELGFDYERQRGWHSSINRGGAWLPEAERKSLDEAGNAMEAAIVKAVADGRDVAVADVMDLASPWAPFLAYWFSLGTSRDIDQVSVYDSASYNDTGEDWPLKQGYGALVARWAADVPVTLNAPVSRVTWSGTGARVESAKGTVTGRHALVCVSTNILASGMIAFDPGLPDWKRDAVAALPLGVHNRIGILLEGDPFAADIKDDATIMLEGDEVPMSVRIKPFGFPYVVGVTGGRFGSWLERAGQQASVDYLAERLVKTFGANVRKAISKRVIVTAWEGDPWTLGSYAASTPGNGPIRAELARSIDDVVHFAGEATHASFFATCHGAYLSGRDRAEEIAAKLKTAA
jgi:monoamine oxidase